jgi:hypothetical protein
MDAVIVGRLIGSTSIEPPTAAAGLADFGDPDALLARWQAAPEASRRVRRLPLGTTVAAAGWARAAFPDFGLYVFHHDDLLIAFRCAAAPPQAAPRGHRHDDNLGVEVRLPAAERRDPGSFVYTPSIEQRNRYRAAAAHDAPRANGQTLSKFGSALFDFEQRADARCLYWRADGVAGEAGGVLRIVRLSPTELSIFDCVEAAATLEDPPAPLPVSFGYGRL